MLQSFPNSVEQLKRTLAGVFLTGDANLTRSDKFEAKNNNL